MSVSSEILLARNSRDQMIVTDPTSTFFTTPLIDHTPFQQEYRAIPYLNLRFGESISCAVPTVGDLLASCVIYLALPSVAVADGFFRWKRAIGYQAIQSISLQIGQTLVQSFLGSELQIWQRLHELPEIASGPDRLYQWQSTHLEAMIQVPIPFFFSQGAAASLPLYLLPLDQEVLITIQFSEWSGCVERSDRLLLLDRPLILARSDTRVIISGAPYSVVQNRPLANELLVSSSSPGTIPAVGDLATSSIGDQAAIIERSEIILAEPEGGTLPSFQGSVQLVYYQLSDAERDLGRSAPWQVLFRSITSISYPIVQTSASYPLLAQSKCASMHWQIVPNDDYGAFSWRAKIAVDGKQVSQRMPSSYYQTVEPYHKYPLLADLACYCTCSSPGLIIYQTTLDLARAKSAFLQIDLGSSTLGELIPGMTLMLYQIGYQTITIADGLVVVT